MFKMECASEDAEIAKLSENENVKIKKETEFGTIKFDEVHVKQEVDEESLEHVSPGSPDYKEYNYINYEIAGTSQGVYRATESSNYHQETSPEFNQYTNGDLSVVADKHPASDGTADADEIPGSSQCDPTPYMKPFAESLNEAGNIEFSSAGIHHIFTNSFTQTSKLNAKKLKHTEARPYICDVCNQAFTRRSHLNIHNRIHTGESPFSCDVCNYAFTQKGALNRHKLKHTGERPFSCDICNQTFTQKCNLNTHKLNHTGVKPFICDICNQTFTIKSHLNTHRLKHTGERPFSCDMCSKTFTQTSDLNRHKLKHTGERPFPCNMCSLTFTQKGHLNRHKLKQHNVGVSLEKRSHIQN